MAENNSFIAARAYVARGLAVFPLDGKRPLTEHGVKDATTDLGVIETWFAQPGRNIGIAIPEGVVIVDVDPRNGGSDSFLEWLEGYGWDHWTDAPNAKTGGGGDHYWFRLPEGVTKLKKNPAPGIDLLTVGRYVVAPPSVTDAKYRWEIALPQDLTQLEELPGFVATLAQPEERVEWADSRTVGGVDGGDPLDTAAHGMTTWDALLVRAGWKRVDGAGTKWRHPNTANDVSATIKHDCLFVYCVDEATEALTHEGWRKLDEIKPDDRFLTLDPDTLEMKWEHGEVNVFPAQRRVLARIRNKRFDALTTADHRWLVDGSGRKGVLNADQPRHFETTREMYGKNRRIITGGGHLASREAVLPDEIVELIGWVITEGHYPLTGSSVRITQSATHNALYVERIERLAEYFRGRGATVSQYRRDTAHGDMREWYFGTGIGEHIRNLAPGKQLTPDFLHLLDEGQRRLLYRTLMDGDGHVDKTGCEKWAQKDPRRIDAFQMLCAMLGRRTHALLNRYSACSAITAYKASTTHTENCTIEPEWYSGRVWCPTTPNGTWFARRNGFTFWTGNSPNTEFPVTEPGDPHGITLFSALVTLDYHGDQTKCLNHMRDEGLLPERLRYTDIDELVAGIKAQQAQQAASAPVTDQDDELPGDDSGDMLGVPINWRVFWRQEDDGEDRWLSEPIIAKGRAHALYAGAKTGKSLLLLQLCAALATGRPFLDKPAHDPIPVLYADYEMTEEDLRQRLEQFGYGPDDDLSGLRYYLLGAGQALDTLDGGKALIQAATDASVKLVVIDTTARAVAGAENDADTLRAFYRCSGVGLKRLGISWVRVDHGGKDASKGQRGTSAKNDDVDVVWRLGVTGGEHAFDLEATHQRMGWVPRKVPLTLKHLPDGGLEWMVRRGARTYSEGVKELAEKLDTIHVPTEVGWRAAKEALKAEDITFNNNLLSEAIAWRKEAAFSGLSAQMGRH